MFLIFDTETTGLPRDYNAPVSDTDNWPRMVQLAWQLHDAQGNLLEVSDMIVFPEGYDIPYNASKIHGITTERAQNEGKPLAEVLAAFNQALQKANYAVGHNINFDMNIVGCELVRANLNTDLQQKIVLDTCTERTATLCKLPGGRGGKFKLPNLAELYKQLFKEGFDEAHNAAFDVEATTRAFLELVRIGHFTATDLSVNQNFVDAFIAENKSQIKRIGLASSNAKTQRKEALDALQTEQNAKKHDVSDLPYAHLHNHTQYSILQATSNVNGMVKLAVEMGMPGVAITDFANLMGAFKFNNAVMGLPGNIEAYQHNQKVAKGEIDLPPKPYPFKGIIGCEFYVCQNHQDRTQKDNGYQVVALAKNKKGYHNLAKLSSYAYLQGMYYVPRIDKQLLEKHKEGLIILSGGLTGELANLILNVGENQAEQSLEWYKAQFGADFYIELNRHGLDEQTFLNDALLRLAKKHDIKYVAANNTFYLEQSQAEAHDILLCIKEGTQKSQPIGRGRGFRFGFPNNEFYFKTADEMRALFADLPEALNATQEILDKIEMYELKRDVLLPNFDIPEEFKDPQDVADGGKRGENAYLRHLTYLGAEKRYGEITTELRERIDFELETIAKTGYPGYFLIVQDFCEASRRMDVAVGPGRGSAAGSVVAYCNGITNVDPIKYDLLFERFLNPERVSLPDIDIDFEDNGREKVIQYVIDKYGDSQVAQIITYGTMAAKSAIRDAGRVMELPLQDTDRLAKLVPLNRALHEILAKEEKEIRSNFNGDDASLALALRTISGQESLEGRTLRQAGIIEGSVRNIGTHACGVIITPTDIRELIPVTTVKDSNMWCTQFDNAVVESAGLLKMDFLGLSTLTIIKDAVRLVKQRHNITLVPDDFPLDDEKTYELFQRGDTGGIFQYESVGMQKYLRELRPTVFADLIAMNALYRPGPIEYIPKFINRKLGIEPIEYDVPEMAEYLAETYGITVYQEQVMLLSQSLAGFTKGEADVLRKAMGKKQRSVLDKMKPQFISQAAAKGHPEPVLEKVWKDWEAFASYAFNKSHSTCYAYVAYQTAYLKAHYPAEYMAAVLSNNMADIKKVTFFMEDCKRNGIEVLGPDVNESEFRFTVNAAGAIRFGLGGMKGIGEAAVEHLVAERANKGRFTGIFNLLSRIELRIVNKRSLESMALGGAFDSFEGEHRAIYFYDDGDGRTFLEKVMKFAQNSRAAEENAQVSLFGEASGVSLPEPPVPQIQEWPRMVALRQEKEVNGVYLSSHPLASFDFELKYFTNSNTSKLQDLAKLKGKEVQFGGIITEVNHRIAKNGNGWGAFKIEDYFGDYEFRLFRDSYLKFKHFLDKEQIVWIRARVKERYRPNQEEQPPEYELEFLDVKLMSALFEDLAKKVTVTISLENINGLVAQHLADIAELYKGKSRLAIKVMYANQNLNIDLIPQKIRVKICPAFIDDLLNLPFESIDVGV